MKSIKLTHIAFALVVLVLVTLLLTHHSAWSEPIMLVHDNNAAAASSNPCAQPLQTYNVSALQSVFGIQYPMASNATSKELYESIIHPLHLKWTELLSARHIEGGEGYSAQLVKETMFYIDTVREMVRYKEQHSASSRVLVCETGFNMGHSALTYLLSANSAASKVHYLGFSFPINNHQLIAKTMKDVFALSEQLTVLWGDSTKYVPYFVDTKRKSNSSHECDIVIVDGGHSENVAWADIRNMKELANPQHHILIVDDLACDAGWCMGPKKAWQRGKTENVLTETGCLSEGKDRGFCWGQYNFSSYLHDNDNIL